jgi:hypothetical protein
LLLKLHHSRSRSLRKKQLSCGLASAACFCPAAAPCVFGKRALTFMDGGECDKEKGSL